MPQSNVVITGLGVVSSIGIGAAAFFDGLREKRSGITSLANRTDGCAVLASQPDWARIAGRSLILSPSGMSDRERHRRSCSRDPNCLAASHLAIEQAGLIDMLPLSDSGALRSEDVGTVFGSESEDLLEMEDAIRSSMTEDGESTLPFGRGHEKDTTLDAQAFNEYASVPCGYIDQFYGPNNTVLGCLCHGGSD